MPDLGPLNVFLSDPSITEIMVNDIRNIMIEREGQLLNTGATIASQEELNRLTRAILDATGRILSPDSPYADVMLADGSRVNIVAPPLTRLGPCITIRKFPRFFTPQDLLANGTFDQRIGYFLNVCVAARLNLLICGGTGSGKTTLLNALLTFVPQGERVITIEDTPELLVPHKNSVALHTKPVTPGSGAVTARELVSNALRMRPDRLIVGEVRRGEALDMLQAMNTGHEGSMTTIHANSPRDGLTRLETLCLMAGISQLPLHALRKQISEAIDLVVQIKRDRTGVRRISEICEITGMEGEVVTMQDLFSHTASSGFRGTGYVPTFLDRLKEQGIELPPGFFEKT